MLVTAFALGQSIVVIDETLAPAVGVPFKIASDRFEVTDAYGRLSISECRDSFALASGLYTPTTLACPKTVGDTITIKALELALATVTATRATFLSGYSLSTEYIERIPAILGEPDLLRSIQSLPGVSGGAEGSVAPAIRGGSADQTLVLLDEAVLYSPVHFLGYQSAISADIAGSVSVHMGRYPVKYGDRVSGIVEIQSRDGRRDRHKQVLGVGVPNASALVEGPLGLGSYLMNARIAYPGLFTLASDVKLMSGDWFAKIALPVGKASRFEATGFQNRDILSAVYNEPPGSRSLTRLTWGNTVASFKYVTDGSLGSTSAGLTFSSYVSNVRSEIKQGGSVIAADRNRERRDGAAVWLRHVLSPMLNGRLTSYAQLKYDYSYRPVGSAPLGDRDRLRQHVSSLGLYNRIRLTPQVSLEAGGRLVTRNSRGGYSTWAIEPRTALLAEVGATRYTFSYDRMTQPVHVVSTGGDDTYRSVVIPESNAYPATTSNQWALGVERGLGSVDGSIRATVYYRNLDDVVQYVDGFQTYSNLARETPLALRQDGRAYGFESFTSVSPRQASTSSLGYALTWSERRTLGELDWQRFRFDRRHSLQLLHTERLSDKWTVNAQFTFRSGFAFREPTYVLPDNPFFDRQLVPIYDDRYERSTPPTHHLDLSFHRRVVRDGRQREWILSLYNLYGRDNPSAVYYLSFYVPNRDGGEESSFATIESQGFLRFIPGILYRIEL